MIQNKIWFFTEGLSEYHFVSWLIRNHFYGVENCKDEIEFIKSENKPVCYITDCKNGEKIPYEISDNYYKVKQSLCSIVVVCDLEKDPCPLQRKENFFKNLKDDVKKESIKFVFSNPILEEIYCFESDLTEKILRSNYQAKHNTAPTNIDLSCLKLDKSPFYNMQRLFQNYQLPFKKTQFAEKFFSQFDYIKSTNKTVKRLVTFLKEKYDLNPN